MEYFEMYNYPNLINHMQSMNGQINRNEKTKLQ